MKIYYYEKCKTEFELVKDLLNWLKLESTEELIEATFTRNNQSSGTVLTDNHGKILGIGFFNIVKYLEGKNNAR